ncbi:MAG: response regulator [Aquabacterium sp.]
MSATQGDVLIVDDVGSSRELLATVLKQVCVMPFRMARDVSEALSACQEKLPEIVFLDIDLPDQSGLEVLKQVHARNPDVFIVMVSGVGTPDNVKQARERGAAAFILKPYKPQKVVEALAMYERKTLKPALRPDAV